MAETPEQFAARVRKVYNSYADVPDLELAQKMVEKHPEYKDRVDFSSITNVVADTMGQALSPLDPVKVVSSPFGQAATTPTPPAQFVGEGYKQLGDVLTRANPIPEPIAPATSSPAAMLQSAAHLAGSVPGLASKGLGTLIGGISAADLVTMAPLGAEMMLKGLLKKNLGGKSQALFKLAEVDPMKALKSGLDVQDWGKVDEWLKELKASAPHITEAEWEPVVAARAKSLFDELMGVLPEMKSRPGFIGPGPDDVPTPNLPAKAQDVIPSNAAPVAQEVKPAQTPAEFKAEMAATPNAPVWTSKLQQTLEDPKIPAVMPSEGLLNTLKNKGVKPEELEWSGLQEFLAGKKKVTKPEVQKFLKENPFELEEIVHADTGEVSKEMWGVMDADGEIRDAFPTRGAAEQARRQFARQEPDLTFDVVEGPENQGMLQGTRYADYQVPGGKDYKEILFKLPSTPQTPVTVQKVMPWTTDKNIFDVEFSNGKHEAYTANSARTAGKMAEADIEEGKFAPKADYQTSHFDEPNVLAHARVNDRTIGKDKVRFVEEVQSDWHQQGREEGYIGKTTGTTPADMAQGVPDAPFKKTWHEMVMKRMIRQAVEDGKDGIAWTSGATQNKRYNLSNWVSKIEYSVQQTGDKKTFGYKLYKKNGDPWIMHEGQTQEEVAKTIGKGPAAMMAEQQGHHNALTGKRFLATGDLEVGGSGMKGFYDKILPDFVNNFTKKWGGKVTQHNLEIAPALTREQKSTLRDVTENILEGGYTYEEAKDAVDSAIGWNGLTEDLFDDMLSLQKDPSRRSTPAQWANELAQERIKEMKSTPEAVHYLKFTPELKRAALKVGFPLFTGLGTVGLAQEK